MRRGDVFWADLSPRTGSEQQGRRPVIIVSNDGFNRTLGWRSLIVVPISRSTGQARRGPTAVPLDEGTAGLKSPGVALCHQVTTLDRAKLRDRIGVLAGGVLAQVDGGLKAALDLE